MADSVDELIEEHMSIERSLVQIHMPRMSVGELTEILHKNLGLVEMMIDDHASERIARLSHGLPQYAHLLGLHAAESTTRDGRELVTSEDVSSAIDIAVKRAQQSIINRFH